MQNITGGQAILRRYGVPASQLQDEDAWHAITETITVAVVNLARNTRVEAICVDGGIGCNSPYFRIHLANVVRDQTP